MTQRISLAGCKAIYAQEIAAGVLLDDGKLDGAVNAPFQSAFGGDAFPSVIEKAAKLGESIALAHAYSDGNKRLAWHMVLAFLELNGIDIIADQVDAAETVIALVEHRIDRPEFARWLLARIVAL